MKTKNRLFHRLLLGIFVASLFSTALSPIVSAKAATSMTPTEQAKSLLYYNALSACMSNVDLNIPGLTSFDRSLKVADAASGAWFAQGNVLVSATDPSIGYFLAGKGFGFDAATGKVGCSGDNVTWIKDAIQLWGYKDGIELLCNEDNPGGLMQRGNGSPCMGGSGTFDVVGGGYRLSLNTFRTIIKNKVYGGKAPDLSKPAWYALYRDAFFGGCLEDPSPSPYLGKATEASNTFIYAGVKNIDATGKLITASTYLGKKTRSTSIEYYVDSVGNNIGATCASLVVSMNANSSAYQLAVQVKPDSPTANDTGNPDVTTTTCAIDGIGWIVCPVMNFMGKITDSAFNFLASNFLETKSDTITNPATKNAWSVMRNLANVAFVIAFLIIIFSQMTSVGITNYGVKKMLPRLVVAAILVNLSFVICQIAVDISNILGYSLKSMFDNFQTYTQTPGAVGEDASTNGWGIATLVTGILAGSIGLALAVTVPVLFAALLALIMIVLILFGRTALIILLVVVSPLAFVAYLLPNTEQWFKKWYKMFISLLMVFPVIAVVVGASGLAAGILKAAAGDDKMLQVVAMGVATIPLFIVPSLLKNSLSAAGAIGAKLSAASSKASGRATSTAKGNLGDKYKGSAFARGRANQKQGKEEFRNRRFTNAAAGDDTSLMGRMRQRASRGVTGRTFTEAGDFAQDKAEKAARGASARAEAKDYSEAVEAATASQRNLTVGDVATIAATGTHNGQRVTEHQRAAAIDRTMSSGGFSQRRAVLEGLATDKQNTTRELRNRAVSAAYSKGDQNIFGTGFGDQILDEGGSINSAADLASATVTNAQEGHVAAEHIVQNSSATEYLVGATLASGNATAQANLVTARDRARSTATTQAKIDDVMEAQFARL